MIRPLSKTILLFNAIRSPCKLLYTFSAEQPEEGEFEQLNRAENFYRNSIRSININDKGRGKFTEHHLYRLTKLTQKASQLPLLFEGYYNYLGHFTVISSKTVDRMLDKAMSFEDASLDPILDIFHNHNYLSYFPSYETTLKFLSLAEKDSKTLYKFFYTLIHCPLIKFNKQIVEKLLSLLKDQSLNSLVYSRLVKLLVQRSALHIIDEQISQQDLFKQVISSLETRLSQEKGPSVKSNSIIRQFLEQLNSKEEKSEDQVQTLAILGLFFKDPALFCDNLSLINNKDRVQTILSYLGNTSGKNFDVIAEHIESQEISEDIKAEVQRLRANRGQSENQEQEEKQQ